MYPDRMKKKHLQLAAFTLASILLLIAVWKYPAAGVAAVAGAFALIADVIANTGV